MKEPPYYGLAVPAAAERQKQLAEEYLRQVRSDMRQVMGTPTGRRFIWHVMEGLCGVFASTETGDERQTALRQGARGVGLLLQKELQDGCAAEFVLLLRENFARTLEQLAQAQPREDSTR